MRYIFFFLIGANVALFAWGALGPDAGVGGHAKPGVAAGTDVSGSGVQPVELLAAGVPGRSGDGFDTAADRDGQGEVPVARCDTIGPLGSGKAAEELANQIRATGAAVRLFSRRGELQRDYWVLLPPLPTRQEALLRFQEFQSRNVDSFVITQGAMANAISLGLFTRKPLALDLQARLQGMGYKTVEVREVPRDNQEVWLRVVSRDAGPGHDPSWQVLMEDRPEVVRREAVCEEGLLSGLHALELPPTRGG